jgi:hypothetical protein
MLIVGIVLLLDILLPTSTESLQIDQHTSSTEQRPSAGTNARSADTSYTLHFAGGRVSSCSVGYSAYWKLKDGDTVVVQATKLFKNCIRITRGEEIVQANKYWKLLALIGGGLLVAAAIGWLKTEEDGSLRIA